jgi:selenide, water dikinase
VHDIPILAGIGALVAAGHIPGGTGRNLAWVREQLDAGDVPSALLDVLADPQTSGGLLVGTSPPEAADLVARLRASGHDAAIIGTVEPGGGTIRLR